MNVACIGTARGREAMKRPEEAEDTLSAASTAKPGDPHVLGLGV